MANPTDVMAGWQRNNLYFWLTTAIGTAPTLDPTIALRSSDAVIWPTPNAEVEDLGLRSSGIPMRKATEYKVGANRPSLTIEHPLNGKWAALSLTSLLQVKGTYATQNYQHIPYTDAQAKWFLGFETGVEFSGSENSVEQVYGMVAKTCTFTLPIAGPNRGRAMLRTEFLVAAHGGLKDTITGTTPPAPLTGTGVGDDLIETADFTMAGAGTKFVDLELTISNNADFSPNATDPPDAIHLGDLSISGKVTVAMATGDTDEWAVMRAGYAAGTQKDMVWTAATALIAAVSCLFQDSGPPSVQGNVLTASFPFIGVYKDATSPKFTSYAASDFLSTWT